MRVARACVGDVEWTCSGLTRSIRLVSLPLQLYSLEHCVLGAYARDGGMFLPASLPDLRPHLARWSTLSFQGVVAEFLALFIDEAEVPRRQLEDIIKRAFDKFTYEEDASSSTSSASKPIVNEIAFEPLVQLSPAERRVVVAELWHGHTLAFKDLPLQVLGGLLDHFLARRKEVINILVGTSGDTGSAAIEAVRRSPHVNIFVLYPAGGRITRVQELQMTTVDSPLKNVHVVACDGTSDDLDVPILRMFDDDKAFAAEYKLCSINSVNVIRILMQCTHFIWAYLRVAGARTDALVDFAIPTGAAGHIAAGILTKQMHLPIGQLVAATNENDLLATFLTTGDFYPRATGALQTTSPAIDIQVPYNVERMLYLMAPGSPQEKGRQVRVYLDALAGTQRGFRLSPVELGRWRDFGLVGKSADAQAVSSTIRQIWQEQQYLVDPHTAVAVAAARSLGHSAVLATRPEVVVFATAHAAKFLPTVSQATGLSTDQLQSLFARSPWTNVRRAMVLHKLPEHAVPFEKGEDWTRKLRDLIVDVNNKQRQGQPAAAIKAKL